MAVFVQRHWFKLLVVLLLLVIGFSMFFRGGNEKMPVIKKAQTFQLTNADGQSVRFADDAGKVRVVYFFFGSCPDVCYPTNHILSKVQEELAKEKILATDAVMYSISFDPQRDTPEKLKEYANSLNADAQGWKFLRGDEKTVFELAEQYGVGIIKGNDGNYAHNNVVALVDRDGNIRKFFNAARADVKYQNIAKSIRQLAEESAK